MNLLPNKPNSRLSSRRQGPLFGGWGGGQAPIPPTPPLGPLDVVGMTNGYFTNFSQNFDLARDCAVVGFCCHFTGNPVIAIAHGGEPLTILKQERSGNHLALLAYGTGLTIESAPLTVTATGGQLNGGALRINEIDHTTASGVGWIDGLAGSGKTITPATQEDVIGGIVKGALVHASADRYHVTSVSGATNVWNGFTTSGTLISADTTTSGAWVLGAGWSIDGNAFVHTGPSSTLTLPFASTTGIASARMEATVDSGEVRIGPTSVTNDRYGVGFHYVCTASGFAVNQLWISANGDCRIEDVTIVENAALTSWLFCSTPAVDGGVIEFTQPYGPAWSYALAEVTCSGPDSFIWQSFELTAGATGTMGNGYAAAGSPYTTAGSINRQPYTGGELYTVLETTVTKVAFKGDIRSAFGEGYTLAINGTPLAIVTPLYLVGSGSLLETHIDLQDFDMVPGQTYTIERVPVPSENWILTNGEWNDDGVWKDGQVWED